MGDTPNERYFSFLSPQRFRLQKDNKADSFEAQLVWVQDSKEPEWRSLSEARSSSSVPRVKYLPQRYFEELCNDHVKGDDKLLQGELRSVIFSHIPVNERDGADSLDELIALRTDVVEREASTIQADLKVTNARIIQLIEQVNTAATDRARESVRLSLVGLRALRGKPCFHEVDDARNRCANFDPQKYGEHPLTAGEIWALHRPRPLTY